MLRVGDLGSETGLEIVERGYASLLLRDLLLELCRLRLGIGQLIAACDLGRDGRAEHAHEQGDHQDEGVQPLTRSTSRTDSGLVRPAKGSGTTRVAANGAAHHLGGVIVRAISVGRRMAGAVARSTVSPPVPTSNDGHMPQDDDLDSGSGG